jgi:hypothetical protein
LCHGLRHAPFYGVNGAAPISGQPKFLLKSRMGYILPFAANNSYIKMVTIRKIRESLSAARVCVFYGVNVLTAYKVSFRSFR